jgi:hypothetical protein
MNNIHIIFVESKGSVFNDATFFNTNACSFNGDVLMHLNALNAWYNGIDNKIYAINCAVICQTLRKAFLVFQMQMCASILFSLQLIIIFFNFFVIILSFLLDKMCNN